jgi:DNA-directed RNA polymerase subunit RPC12/RpoP
MKWYKKYFENRRYFECPECGRYFSLSFWEWLRAQHLDNWHYRHIRCPYCKRKHWLKAIEVMR